MDISLTVILGFAGLAALIILAAAAKILFKLLKFLILAALVAAIAGFAWTQLRSREEAHSPRPTPPVRTRS